MKNFNLLVSTSRFNETNARSELWFLLFICGDTYPIISGIQFPGLITALTDLNPIEIISKINLILERNPNFFQFILKIIPINFICKTDIQSIKHVIIENHKKYIDENDSFRIILKRRHHEKIERNTLIETVANIINNKVDLENPDKIIRIEILGNISGISFLKKNEIIRIKKKK